MRVVLDTNIICQIILPGLYNYDVWERFLDGDYTICYSNDILLEYEEILLCLQYLQQKVAREAI